MVHEKKTHAMTLVDPCVHCERNTHPMTLGVVHEKNTHPMTLVDPYVVCEKNTHAITLGGSLCGLREEHTCNDTGDMWFVKRTHMQ